MKTTTSVVGPSFISLLTLLFIGLKLTGYITWSWWWVLSPLWISWGLAIILIGGVVLFAALLDRK